MNLRFASLAIVGAITVVGSLFSIPDNAHARMGNSSFAGPKGLSSAVHSRPTPTPPRTAGGPQLNVANSKLKLRCYHRLEHNRYGMRVHRTHCG